MPVARTAEIDDNTLVDLDDTGGVVGIEVLSTAHRWSLAGILDKYSIPAAEIAQVCAYFRPAIEGFPERQEPTVSSQPNAPMLVGVS